MGRVDSNTRLERMMLILGPTDEMQPGLRTFIESLHDKKSPNYHQWLTPAQFGDRFGPAQSDMAKIAAWLQQQGFDGVKVSPGRSHIEFSGSAQMVEGAFGAEMHFYQVGSETHVANNSDISIPRALSGMVRGLNLQNLTVSKPALTKVTAVKHQLSTGRWTPAQPESDFYSPVLIDPNDFAKIYDLDRAYNSGITGKGVTIAVVSRTTAVEMTDVEAFRTAYHLPPKDPTVIMNGPPSDVGGYGAGSSDAQESTLDVEWAGAVAPEATIDLVVSGTTVTTDGVELSAAYIVDNNLADIMTLSFGECEANLGTAGNSFYNAIYAQAAAQGISTFVATGDSGAASCDDAGSNSATGGLTVSGLASTPFDTAVGGTSFNEGGNYPQYWTLDGVNLVPNGYIPETVWNESATYGNLFGTGGGVSTIYPKPAWQSTSLEGVPNDNARDLPDVSLTAALHDGYVICLALLGPCTTTTFGDQSVLDSAAGVGGTSASVQVFGAMMALVDQKQGGRQGLANYGLYQLASNESYANCNSSNATNPAVPVPAGCIFNDITAGNNGVPGNDTLGSNPPPGDVAGQVGYNATPGFDPASGLGSVDGFNLVNGWNSLGFAESTTSLSATSSTSVAHGQPVSFSVTVASASGSGMPTGSVGLIAKTSAPFATGVGVGGGTLVNGVFTGTINTLPGGQYSVVAHYAGDANFAPSDSNPVSVNVGAEPSTTTLIGYAQTLAQSSPSPLSFGYGVGFPVGIQVSSQSGFGNATGTVTIYDNGQAVAQTTVNNQGFATVTNCQTAGFCLDFGTHSLTASYSGDAGLTPSTTAQPFVYNIVKSQPIMYEVMEGWNVGNVFVEFGFTQSTLPKYPTGTVTITDHTDRQVTTIATYDVTQAPTYDYFFLPPGQHWLFSEYSGDANYLPVTVGPIFQPMYAQSGVPNTVTITPLSPIVVGKPVTLKATVTSTQSNAIPTGYIIFESQLAYLNPNLPASLTNGSATITAIMPNAGPIVAQYEGDSTFAQSVGILKTNQAAAEATPSVTVTSNLSAVTPGQQVTLTTVVAPPPQGQEPSGFIQLYDAVNGAAPAPLGPLQQMVNSNSTYLGSVLVPLTTSLPLGTHVITASYTGDGNYKAVSSSASIPVTVSVVNTLPTNPVSANFGSVDVGKASTQGVNVLFGTGGTVNSIQVLTQGAANSSFEYVDAGTCVTGTPFSAGQSCMVDVAFAPDFSGPSLGAVVLTDANGNVLGTQYITGQGGAAQIAFDYGSPSVVESATNGGLNGAGFVTADGLGSVYIADNLNQRVVKVLPPGCSATNSCQTVIATSANGLGGANGVAVDGAGNLYVSDQVNNQVLMIPSGCKGAACTQVVASKSAGEISSPQELAVDGAGDLFIADLNLKQAIEVPAGCKSATCQKPLGSGLGGVYGVAVDAAGDVFLSDNTNGAVVKLPAGCTGGSCQTTVASGLVNPMGISVDAAGNLYIAEPTQVIEVSAATGNQAGLVTGAALGASANLTDVAVGPGGSVFIADLGDNQVSRLDRGDPPSLSFQNTVAFGTVTAPTVVTVENIGTQALDLASIAVTPQTALDPATTSCVNGGEVASGASCQLGIEFAPSQLTGLNGNYLTGNILLTDNSLNEFNSNFNGNNIIQRAGTQTILVSGYAGNNQTINFPALPGSVPFGTTPITLQATATSGLPVTYTVSGPASVSGSTLTLLSAGTVTVTATQPGNAEFAAASPVSLTVTVTPVPATFALSSSTQSVMLAAGQSGTATLTVTPSGGFNSQVSFSCSAQNLVTCSFQPATLSPSGAAVTTTVTLAAPSTTASLRNNRTPMTLAAGFLFGGLTIVLMPFSRRRRKGWVGMLGIMLPMLAGLVLATGLGCGGGSSKPPAPTPQTGQVAVTATGGGVSQTVTLSVTVTK